MMDKDAFIVGVVSLWKDHACMDIDGADFQDLLVKHGLATGSQDLTRQCQSHPRGRARSTWKLGRPSRRARPPQRGEVP